MKQLFAILLSGIMLFVSLGPIMSSHYCGGELAESAIGFGYREVGCEMKQHPTCDGLEHGTFFKKKDCCENEYLQFKLDENLSKVEAYASMSSLDFNAVVLNLSSPTSFFTKRSLPDYLNLIPPNLDLDLILLNQSFRI